MSKRELYERVDEAMARGEVWRAKEMLRGSVRTRGYDTELYETYGRLLLELQEVFEAGKYLFLSGQRRPEYEHAIGLYLSRTKGDSLYLSFPRAGRLREVSAYPEAVRPVLEREGLPMRVAAERELDDGLSIGCWVGLTTAAVLAVALAGFAALGFWFTLRWLLS